MALEAQPSEQKTLEQMLHLVGFTLGDEQFGIDILQVREIIRLQELTRVPKSPPFVQGVMNLRGKVIPIISLRKRFGLEECDHGEQTRIVVLEAAAMLVGFIVDSVTEVLHVPISAISPAPRLGKVEREFVSGIGQLEERLVILLDVERIMSRTQPEQASAPAT